VQEDFNKFNFLDTFFLIDIIKVWNIDNNAQT